MIRRVFLAALAALAGGLLLYDFVAPPESGLLARTVGDWWFALHKSSLNGAQAGIQRYVAPWLWDPVFVSVLQLPAWLLRALAGAGLWAFWRPRKTHSIANFKRDH